MPETVYFAGCELTDGIIENENLPMRRALIMPGPGGRREKESM